MAESEAKNITISEPTRRAANNSIRSMPKYPNWGATLGSYGPVVGALLSAVSTACFVKAFDRDLHTKTIDIFAVVVDSRDASIVFGVFSTILMILATFAFLYAQASDFESMPNEKQDQVFKRSSIADDRKEYWRNRFRDRSMGWFNWGEMSLEAGFVTLLLTLMSLIFPYACVLAVVLGFTSLGMSSGELLNNNFEGRLGKFMRGVLLIGLGGVSVLLIVGMIRSSG